MGTRLNHAVSYVTDLRRSVGMAPDPLGLAWEKRRYGAHVGISTSA